MTIQIRNTLFDAEDIGQRAALNEIMEQGTVLTAIKKEPVAKASSPVYVYEIAMIGAVIHLEIAASKNVAAMEALIVAKLGGGAILLRSAGWDVGVGQDRRMG